MTVEVKVVPLNSPVKIAITEPGKASVKIVEAPGRVGPQGPEGPAVELLGVSGNNELTITGIENRTVVEGVSISEWRWLRYMVSLSKTSDGVNKFYFTELTILIDSDNINVSESNVIDNDGDMGTISVSRNGSNLELVVTPLPNIRPITVRYARMGLKS
jgi:hypothetical protein